MEKIFSYYIIETNRLEKIEYLKRDMVNVDYFHLAYSQRYCLTGSYKDQGPISFLFFFFQFWQHLDVLRTYSGA